MAHNSIELYPRNESPFDVTWEDWATKWWNWIFRIPMPYNPIDGCDRVIPDKDGLKDDPASAKGQEHPAGDKVVFLAGARHGIVNRTISNMPANKGCFFPVATCECSCAEFPSYNNEQLEKCAKDGNKVSHMEVNIDGQVLPIEELRKYFVETKLFDLQNIVKGNTFCATEAGKSNSYSVGYWLFLRPLKSGSQFDLSVTQSTDDDEFSKTFNCAYSVNYKITVV
jgi:hypothetical protein